MATLDREFVKSMADVRARAEFLAALSRDVYRDAARNAPGLHRDDRAALLRTSRDYARRLTRIQAK